MGSPAGKAPLDPTPGPESEIAAALPDTGDVAGQAGVFGGTPDLYVDQPIAAGPLQEFCSEDGPSLVGGHERVWSRGSVEVDTRIYDYGSEGLARQAIDERRSLPFFDCAPDEAAPTVLGTGPLGVRAVDPEDTVDGDDPTWMTIAIEDGGSSALLAWRQVDQYLVAVQLWDTDIAPGGWFMPEQIDPLIDPIVDALR